MCLPKLAVIMMLMNIMMRDQDKYYVSINQMFHPK